MDFLLVVGICLLLAWSAYSVMHSRQKYREKALLFYSELIPGFKQFELIKSSTQFPVLTGIYEGVRVKLVPEADKSVFQRLPRLYLRIYIYVPSTALFRLRRLDIETQSNVLFLPSSFEKRHIDLTLNNQNYRLFLGDGNYPLDPARSLTKLVSAGNSCVEILFHNNFIRGSFLLSKGNQSSYVLFRAAEFDKMVFKRGFFHGYFQAILELWQELNQPDYKVAPKPD